jgi:hypothetical protein
MDAVSIGATKTIGELRGFLYTTSQSLRGTKQSHPVWFFILFAHCSGHGLQIRAIGYETEKGETDNRISS